MSDRKDWKEDVKIIINHINNIGYTPKRTDIEQIATVIHISWEVSNNENPNKLTLDKYLNNLTLNDIDHFDHMSRWEKFDIAEKFVYSSLGWMGLGITVMTLYMLTGYESYNYISDFITKSGFISFILSILGLKYVENY